MNRITLHSTHCAICGTENAARDLYPPNFDLDAFNPTIFSARRAPDRIHYRMVKCHQCGLVRSDPVADEQLLANLYTQSKFDYGTEVENLRRTYGHYLAKLDSLGVKKKSLLEIGCGNGFFLEQALAQGYTDVRGVEPSTEAISRAIPTIRKQIVCDVMRPGLFEAATFDVVCLFQVFDHLSDPAGVLDECLRILKPGGFLLILNHNIDASSARILREHSPIIDIEHTYLYSPKTLKFFVEKHGFQGVKSGEVWNSYTLQYLFRLLPIQSSIKQIFLSLIRTTRLGQIRLRIPLGNLWFAAKKT